MNLPKETFCGSPRLLSTQELWKLLVENSLPTRSISSSPRLLADECGPVGPAGIQLPGHAVSGASVGLAAAPSGTSGPQLVGVSVSDPSSPQLQSCSADFVWVTYSALFR